MPARVGGDTEDDVNDRCSDPQPDGAQVCFHGETATVKRPGAKPIRLGLCGGLAVHAQRDPDGVAKTVMEFLRKQPKRRRRK